jgi:integrase/recombinase XerD
MKPTKGRAQVRPTTKRHPQRIPEILSPDEQARLLGQLDDESSSSIRGRAIVRVLLDTGLRAAELINLHHRDVDLTTGRLWVRQGKGSKDRGLWFNGQTREALEAWLESSSKQRAPADYVFTSLDGRQPLCGRWLRKMVKRLAELAGIAKDVHPHTLRHTFATDLLRKTKNLRLVQKAMGHSDIKTTTIYTHIVDEELEEAMKDLRNGG